MIRYLLSATFFLFAVKLYLLGKQTDDTWFFFASSAFALAAIAGFVRILSTYKGGKRQ